ncbi:hypothetical protein O181_012770 [Austropuccinia psidii MF-1]|uniref:Uncharacterized protein n=1 Tax=Austropuccinia psidii MF-1 TaxID=1389203 RepID=A0A9Q3BYL2_9BASI|nr:hypothetical protein [Austropuccinia psidii MF-1]
MTFFENEFPELVQEPESDPSSLDFSNDPFEVGAEEEMSSPGPKIIKVIGRRHPTLIRSEISQVNILPYHRQPVALLTHTNDSNSFNKALKSPDSEFSIAAVKRELSSIIKLNVWEVIQIKEEYKLIGTMWVLKSKEELTMISQSTKHAYVHRYFYKFKGYTKPKKAALTGRLSSLRELISFSASRSLKSEADIKSEFLNARI